MYVEVIMNEVMQDRMFRRKTQVARNEIDRAMRFKFGHTFCKLQDVSAVCLNKWKDEDKYFSPINYHFTIFTSQHIIPSEVFDQLTELINKFIESKKDAKRECKVHIDYAINASSDVVMKPHTLLESYILEDTYEADFIPKEVFKNSVSIKLDEHHKDVVVVRYKYPYTGN